MAKKLGTILQEQARDHFVGRETELEILETLLEAQGPRVIHLSGATGIGKSLLADIFAARARARGATVIQLDCREIEPSRAGFLRALADAAGADAETAHDVAERLSALAGRVVLVLDDYHLFWLMDTFIRRELCPLLESHVGLLLVGRTGPVGAWATAPGWRRMFRAIELGPLTEQESRALLESEGLGRAAAIRIARSTHGHPLALSVAAGLGPGADLRQVQDAVAGAMADVANEYAAAITDPMTRDALEAACVLRRVTESLLRAIFPHAAPRDTLDRLRALPFVETAADGLFVHEAVRDAIASTFRASDPERYRAHLVAAWRQLRTEVSRASRSELWRYTADILYLLQNPVLREAFFPSGYQPLAVEPATTQDRTAILGIAAQHEGSEGLAIVDAWLDIHPDAFRVCRDASGRTTSYMAVIPGRQLSEAIITADPVAAAWMDDMRSAASTGQSLLIRQVLDYELGEASSEGRTALALGVKRTYMEMRPELRYIYLGGANVNGDDFDWCYPLGFNELQEASLSLDGRPFHTFRLDMGPGSVDGWLAAVLADELGVSDTDDRALFDAEAHELVLPSGRVALTPLEFGVMSLLHARAGKPVSRADLLEQVWGYESSTTSNVVETVVLSIRRKLGDRASVLETVRGTGYRYRP